jgi:hypothetical protein
MRLLIVSDIHDHVWNLAALLAHAPASDRLLVCGDLCSPFIVGLLADAYRRPIHIVFGNNDGDLYRITQNASKHPHVYLHGELLQEDWEGFRVAINHYPEIARSLADSGAYDLVCYGHNHRYAVHHEADTWLVNPGAVMGYDPMARSDIMPTMAAFDTETDAVAFYRIYAGGVEPLPR